MNLNDLIDEASKIHSQIESIGKLKEDRAEIEKEISRRLIKKAELLDNPALDYCFSLPILRISDVNREKRYKSAFDILSQVALFFKMVEQNKGNPILTIDGEVPSETGVILNKCVVRIEKSGEHYHRKLYVDTKERTAQEFNLPENRWRVWSSHDILITPDIFLYPHKTNPYMGMGRVWRTDYSNAVFVGGKPKEKIIYIGRTPFQENQDLRIKKEIIVPKPKYS